MTVHVAASKAHSSGALGLVAGPFSQLISQIWSGQRAADYLTASDSRRHVWHCCLAADSSPFVPRDSHQCDLIYERLNYTRSKDLLVQAFGARPRGIFGFLGRLGAEARPAAVYRFAFQVFQAGGRGAQILSHARKPSNDLVMCIALSPAGLRPEAFERLFNEKRVELSSLPCINWTLARLTTERGSQASRRVADATDALGALYEELIKLPFPSQPWPDTGRLRAVSSRDALAQLGRRFQNCLEQPSMQRDAALRILSGFQYYYVWEGDTPAILKFVRVLDMGWYLEQFSGPRNESLPELQRFEMFESLSAMGCNPMSLVVGDGGGRGSAFWGEVLSGLS